VSYTRQYGYLIVSKPAELNDNNLRKPILLRWTRRIPDPRSKQKRKRYFSAAGEKKVLLLLRRPVSLIGF
jgi:hypothetical protein